MYYLSVIWHYFYMTIYYLLRMIGWCLELVLIFLVFFLGGLSLWGVWK